MEEIVVDIFDIIGPVMVGPSSSHTAGAVRIGYAFDSKLLQQGLDKFTEFLKEN